MADKVEEKKPGFRVTPTLLTMIVATLLIGGQFVTFITTVSDLKGDVKHMKKEIVEIKGDFNKFDKFQDELTAIKISLGEIKTEIKNLK